MNLLKSVSFVVVAGVVAAAGIARAAETSPAPAPAGNVAAGQAASAMCAACHGADGNSTVAMYPKLAGQGDKYLAKQMRDFKSGKRANPIMQGMAAGLSDQNILDLAAYFAAQKRTPAAADPAQVKLGEKIWRGGNLQSGVPACTGCHGPSGRGNVLAAFPALNGQHAEYLETQLRNFRGAARGDLTGDKRENDVEGIMRGVARNLSDSEIKAAAQFASGLYQ